MTEFLANELTRLNSDASSLTAENSEDIVHQSPDNPTTWTNEKHNLYLDHLEVSFVRQLQQSMGLLASCSELNKSEKHLSQKRHADVRISSHQLTVLLDGCWQKINYGRGQPFLSTSADASDALKCPRVQWFGRTCPPASAASQECLVLCSTEKHIAVEGIRSQGLRTCPHQIPASNLYTEYTGQNFADGDGQNNSNNESRAKRLKTALADNSNHDQIVPSWKCPMT
ncbi:uncharacterized protein LOC111389122 isoform X2 [Olea europaea var. sylvestris]|uniref:Uncharacterized protein n=1 Tax=Olea europaea subsp. europaea TaxID=158383 RepID=A0A8S0SFT1_OLEEU|nr:uncharacterized protein LOC111389122 isoform X2 [Olea europaea var. sylvestris]CAA2991572.1 Hypothetical predicted protein [Olea europaea subsp. europaea]